MDDKAPGAEPPGATPGSQLGRDARQLAKDRFAAARTFASVGTVGLSFVFAIAIGTAVGLWLDRVTGWSPFFFITLFVCGLVAGIMNVYRTLSNLPK